MEAVINIIFQRFSSIYCRNNYFDTTSAFDTIVAVRVKVLQVRSSFESFLSMKQPSDVTARNMARRTHLVFVCSPNRIHLQRRVYSCMLLVLQESCFLFTCMAYFFFRPWTQHFMYQNLYLINKSECVALCMYVCLYVQD
jgi:hypothetical protein